MGAVNHIEYAEGIVLYRAGLATESYRMHYSKVLGYDIDIAKVFLAQDKCTVNIKDQSYDMNKHDVIIVPLSIANEML